MEGKPVLDHTNNLVARMFDRDLQEDKTPSTKLTGQYEDEYFKIKLFQNGNAHVWLKRQDLTEKLNVTIAKRFPGCLPTKN